MTEALLQDLEAIRHQQRDLERERARREAEIEAAEQRLRENLAALKDEFGVETLEAARELATDLEKEAREAVEAVRAKLEEAIK